VRRSVHCTALFSVCSLRRAKFPIIYPDLRLDYKVATHPPMLYAETLFSIKLVTYANLPVGSTATEKGPLPAANGEPGTDVRAPSEPMLYAETPI
jgi:hypothetical protein